MYLVESWESHCSVASRPCRMMRFQQSLFFYWAWTISSHLTSCGLGSSYNGNMEETQAPIPSSNCVVLELIIGVIIQLITLGMDVNISGVSVPTQTNYTKTVWGELQLLIPHNPNLETDVYSSVYQFIWAATAEYHWVWTSTSYFLWCSRSECPRSKAYRAFLGE